MIQFDPPVSIKPLSEVQLGSIVRLGANAETIGFCVSGTQDPRKGFAAYHADHRRFNWQYVETATVVSYDGAVIIKPEIESFVSDQAVGVPDSTLYTLEGAPTVMLIVGNNAMRFLNISTGHFEGRQSWPLMSGYRNWLAGVRGGDGEFIELLAVSQTFGTEFGEGPIEPEEV
jgi:hypothetical protein